MATKNATFTLNVNQSQSSVTSQATVTGTTVYGDPISAIERITQSGAVVEEYFYWVPRAGQHVTATTSNILDTSGTTAMSYETNISDIRWIRLSNPDFTVDTSTPGVVNVQYAANTGESRNYVITAMKGVTTLGTWTITQAGGGPIVDNVTVSIEYININVMANQNYGVLAAAAWIQTGSTHSQADWPSTNILSGRTTNDGFAHHITATTSSVSMTVPAGTTIYIFADGKGLTEAAYMKTDSNWAEAQLSIASQQTSTVTLEPASPSYYYMRGSFRATRNTTISVSGDFTTR